MLRSYNLPHNGKTEEVETWCFENGLTDYLQAEIASQFLYRTLLT